METTRRTFITGIGALLAAPAIVRFSSLMPVRAYGIKDLEALETPILEGVIERILDGDMFREMSAIVRLTDGRQIHRPLRQERGGGLFVVDGVKIKHRFRQHGITQTHVDRPIDPVV